MKKNTKAIVNTLVPQDGVTDFEILMLKEFGFECEKRSDMYRFFAKEFMMHRVDEYNNINAIDIEDALKDPKNKTYFDDNKDINDHSYLVIFQNIIRRNKEIPLIEIEGVVIHQEIEPGAFSGFAFVISSSKVIARGTKQFLREAREEIEYPSSLAKVRSSDDNNAYVMAVDGASVRIAIGEACLYIIPTVNDLTVLAYSKGQRMDDPSDAIHITHDEGFSYEGRGM